MKRRRPSKREHILLAASQIVASGGVGQLTLDAAAEAAGVSKGGLLYHFPSKEALIEGMIEQYITGFDRYVDLLMEDMPPETPGRWLRAFIMASFDENAVEQSLVAAVMAVVVNQPELMSHVRAQYTRWKQRAEQSGVSPTVADLIIAATDGYWYAHMLGFYTLDNERRQALRDQLLQFIPPS